ncbi:MAG: hypothetical protein ACFFA0_02460 [Promethearchaeota archaeon]
MVECEHCGQEEADFLSRIDNKWYHIDCYIDLKTKHTLKQRNLGGFNTDKLVWINCGAILIIFYLLYLLFYWMNQP